MARRTSASLELKTSCLALGRRTTWAEGTPAAKALDRLVVLSRSNATAAAWWAGSVGRMASEFGS